MCFMPLSQPERSRCCGPAALSEGTTVTVQELYFNTPARRKFLRTEATEYGHCDETIRRLALAHPQVAFAVRHNGRAQLNVPVQSPSERVAAILGNPNFPKYPNDDPNNAQPDQIIPTAARGSFVIQSAGIDGTYRLGSTR